MERKISIANTVLIIILFILAIAFIYPFVWMLSTSLKTSQEALIDPVKLLPGTGLHFETYARVWQKLAFFSYFFNSVKLSVGTVVGVVFIYSAAGFAIAKLNFFGKNKIFVIYLSLMLVPAITVVVPLYILVNKMGLNDNFWGLLLPIVNGGGPFAVLLFTNFFRSVPTELLESGIIDGAGYFKIYLRIFLPLALPAIATIAIMSFIGSWNGLLWPMVILTTRSKFTLPMGLMYLDSSSFRKWNELMAGSIITIIPLIIGFLGLQKYYIQGITLGTIKG